MVKITSSQEEKTNDDIRESNKVGGCLIENESDKVGIGCLIVIVLIIIGIIFWPSGSSETQPQKNQDTVDKLDAKVMGQMFLEERLKAPSTADYPFVGVDGVVEKVGEDKFRYHSYVDSENSFGAKIRTHFNMTLEYKGNDRWKLILIDTW